MAASDQKRNTVLLYFGLFLVFAAIAAGGFALFPALKGFMRPGDIGQLTLIVSSVGVGIAAFFNPCVLPILPSYLVYQTEAGGAAKASRGALLKNGLFAALGLLAFMALFGAVIGLLGEAFVGAIRNNPEGILWFRRVVGLFLIALGALLLFDKTLSGLAGLERKGKKLSRAGQGGFGRFFVFGFAYVLAGIGCVSPLVGGLALFAFGAGGFMPALTVFVLASVVMAVLMVTLSLVAGFARETLMRIVVAQIRPIRIVGGVLLVLMGSFNIAITVVPALSVLLP